MSQNDAFAQLTATGLTPKFGGYKGPGNCTVKAQWPLAGSPAPSDGQVIYTMYGSKKQCEGQ